MENVHAERSAGWSALCYVAVLVIATFITSPLAPPAYDPAHLALLIDLNRSHLLLGAWLSFPAAAFFLWFLVGLRSYLRDAPGRPEGLPTLALIAGVVMMAEALIAASFESALVYVRPEVFQANGFAGIYGTFIFTQEGLGYAPAAIFFFACAHSMRRHGSAPPWLAWLGYLAALGCAYSTLSIFYSDPSNIMAPTGTGPGLLGALPSAVWIVATGIILIRTHGASSAGPGPALDTPSGG
ncbi:MAG: hypothetical protein JOY69_07420 [Candidatus Eremiobacteraeota bacterium]|nr:hypothetical protein [Candidatus Eremiobacteraeota bacterium]